MRELWYVADTDWVQPNKNPERAYSNPRFFSTPRRDFDKVVVVGIYPEIVAAYEAKGVPVETILPEEAKHTTNPNPSMPKKTNEEVFELSWPELRRYVADQTGRMPVSKAQCWEYLGFSPTED